MKKFKKLSALLLAVVMTIAMAVPAMAASGSEGDKGTIQITGIDNASEVNAYQIVEANYVNGKWDGTYKLTSAAKSAVLAAGIAEDDIYDASKLTAEKIGALASALAKSDSGVTPISLTKDGTTTTWKNTEATAGQYVVLVKGSGKDIYNPMVVALAYDATANIENADWATNTGTVAATYVDEEGVKHDGEFAAGVVKAKHTTVTANKKQLDSYYLRPLEEDEEKVEGKTYVTEGGIDYEKIVYPVVTASTDQEGGDDVDINNWIPFELTAQVPNYNTAIYKKPVFTVSDTMDENFEKLRNIKVYTKDEEGNLTEVTSSNYVLTPETLTNNFKVKFNDSWIVANLEANVVITYEAKLKADCKKDFDVNNNTMKVEYSNNPNQDFTNQPDEGDEDIIDFTNTHTFEVNFLKTNEKNSGEDGYTTLGGAQFTLYRDEECTIVAGTAESSKDEATKGKFKFSGLDAGTYYMKETKAPDGYKANDTTWVVEISATYETDQATPIQKAIGESYTDPYGKTYGPFTKPTTIYDHSFKIKNITVKVTGDQTNFNTTRETGSNEDVVIKNSPTAELPSTGGMGTYIFTIAGVAILAIAASLLIFKRRKADQ